MGYRQLALLAQAERVQSRCVYVAGYLNTRAVRRLAARGLASKVHSCPNVWRIP